MPSVDIGGVTIDHVDDAGGAPPLVFLHEGLGSIELWRSFPADVRAGAGAPRTIVYSRPGYGRSSVVTPPWPVSYMHHEALDVLPALRSRLGIERPVLIGHSDGASIALIHAGAGRWPVEGLVAMAPHEFVEDVTLAGIRATGRDWETTDVARRIGRYHRDPEQVFRAWYDTWLSPAFRAWNIEGYLPSIRCPILAVQGEDDGYATMAQLDAITALATAAATVEQLRLPACGHSPHQDQESAVTDAIARFIRFR